MFDAATARRLMVDGQVRTADVTDADLIEAMLALPRERFVPPALAALAYLDSDIPIGNGRALLKPMVLAKLIQAARVRRRRSCPRCRLWDRLFLGRAGAPCRLGGRAGRGRRSGASGHGGVASGWRRRGGDRRRAVGRRLAGRRAL